jgi:SAM-dependent methyltransferase
MSLQGIPHIDLCSICGKILFFMAMSREGNLCKNCGSYWRTRSVIDAIKFKYRFDNRIAFSDIKPDFSIKSLGMTDDTSITTSMPTKFMHTNSYYDQFPRVDLLKPTNDLHDCFDLVICTDVFEHIPNNIEKAFLNLYTIIKKNGLLVFSVPLVPVRNKTYDVNLEPEKNELNQIHKEYYPKLTSWEHIKVDNSIKWKDSKDEIHLNYEPEFHGGDGLTLTFRLFSEDSVEAFLRSAGFRGVEVFVNPVSKRNIPDGIIFTAWK